MTGQRLFRLVRSAGMVGTTAMMVAILRDHDGMPDGKVGALWALSCMTLFMVYKDHQNRLLEEAHRG